MECLGQIRPQYTKLLLAVYAAGNSGRAIHIPAGTPAARIATSNRNCLIFVCSFVSIVLLLLQQRFLLRQQARYDFHPNRESALRHLYEC
jgi:hypothetical protein